ncbi:MAG: hypothetical protein JRJ78_16855 [Deltaproteobacteria bacterium]|nr:hypothetical protein [Deltaproteobacteria bacterium]
MKRKGLIFAGLIVILLAVAATLLFLFLIREQVRAPGITRLFDIPDFRNQCAKNAYRLTYIENSKLSFEDGLRLSHGSAYGGFSFHYFPLPREFKAIEAQNISDMPWVLRSGKVKVPFAALFNRVVDSAREAGIVVDRLHAIDARAVRAGGQASYLETNRPAARESR